MTTKTQPRAIWMIAQDITANWQNVNYAAKPYLAAMYDLQTVNDKYGYDDAKDIILRFLGNAGSWRGDHARRIKAELKEMVK